MIVVKRKVKDLKPGDILVGPLGVERNVVLFLRATQPGRFHVLARQLGVETPPAGSAPMLERSGDDEVYIEALAPAQERAGELLGLLREACADIARITPAWLATGRALIAEIDPPVPPTLEEALAVLDGLWPVLVDGSTDPDDRRHGPAVALLKRARATGLLK